MRAEEKDEHDGAMKEPNEPTKSKKGKICKYMLGLSTFYTFASVTHIGTDFPSTLLLEVCKKYAGKVFRSFLSKSLLHDECWQGFQEISLKNPAT